LLQQLHCQFVLGEELLLVGLAGQLRTAEIEFAGLGQEPSGLVKIVQQGSQDDPVVGSDGTGPVGAAGGVLAESASAPDLGTAAMDLAVVHRTDAVAIPESSGGVLQKFGQVPF